ncbi:MAG: hypothetical protein Q7T55_05490, partial [Solirubrobacteraceae bacterium]|nr:hypothetical protein [Solirubrobacteraceae bacterium]
MAEKKEVSSAFGIPSQQRRVVWILTAAWTVAIFAITTWWTDDRLREHREQATATAGVRLTGVKDTLTISLRHLAALPLDLSHRRDVPAFVAAGVPVDKLSGAPGSADIQPTLDRLAADFALPLVALIGQDGSMLASSSTARNPGNGVGGGPAGSLATRDYFVDAMKNGAAVQFLLGRASRVPGLYFANRVLRDGLPVGVAVVKQDTDTLNRLLTDADGARVFVTDSNGVVVLANRDDMLMRRIAGQPQLSEETAQQTYQQVPEVLGWEQSRLADGARGMVVTRIGEMRHATTSSALADTTLKVWVLEPLDEEVQIRRSAWTSASAIWLLGGLVIWLSWRRVQSLDAALRARRDIYELTQALPLTVFRYTQPSRGEPRFAFIGRGVEELFGVPAAQF